MKVLSLTFSIFLLAILPNLSNAEIYLNENSTWQYNLIPVYQSSIVAGDLNSDGKIDLVATGYNTTPAPDVKVYLNNGTTLLESSVWEREMTGVYRSSLALGDIDNDGDLDLVLCGNDGTAGITRVYTNNGSTLNMNSTWGINLSDVDAYGCSINLGDIDNDGKLDVVIVGASTETRNGIYINNGTSFVKNSTWIQSFPKVGQGDLGTIVTGDYDNDGDLDMVFGGAFPGDLYFRAYTNNGTSITEDSTWGQNLFPGIGLPSFILGDVDNDGDLDLNIIGTGGIGDRQVLYINNGATFVINQTSSSSPRFHNYFDGSIAFGDYNNDGYLDLASNGKEEGSRSTIYKNRKINPPFEEDTLAETDFRPDDKQESSLLWTDIDNDNDLDLISTGKKGGTSTILFKIYINNITTANNLPSPPTTGLNSTFNSSTGRLTLTWNSGSDTETPSLGLYYNLRVGTCSGCHDVVSGVYGGSSNPTTGYFGNMMQRKSITLNRPDPENKTIYWSVQTIDTGLAKSNWSEEQVYMTGSCMEDWSYSEWSDCVGGTQTRTAVDPNNCGTTDNRSSLSQSCTVVPSGPSGPGGPGTPPTIDQTTATKQWNSLKAAEEETFTVDRTNISVTEIKIRVTESVSSPSITISRLSGNPTPEAPGEKVYQYMEINHTNLRGKLANVTITFAVNSSWIEENDINNQAISLNRFLNDSWERLETELMEAGEEYIYEAESPGLSYFSITGEENLPRICNAGERRCNDMRLEVCSDNGTFWQLLEDCAYGCMNSTCLEKVCQAGQRRCNGSLVEQCNVVRWIPLETCEFGCVKAKCLPSPFYHELLVAAILTVSAILSLLFIYRRRAGTGRMQT